MRILARGRKKGTKSFKNTRSTKRTKVMRVHQNHVQLSLLKSKILLTVSKPMKPKYTKSSKKLSVKNLC